MDEMILQVAGEISKVETMRGGALRLKLDTQENISPEVRTKVIAMTEKLGWFTFSIRRIQPEDILSLPELKKEEDTKTPAQRIRSVLYLLWKKEGENGDFDAFYANHMEKLIDYIKAKIN